VALGYLLLLLMVEHVFVIAVDRIEEIDKTILILVIFKTVNHNLKLFLI